MQDRETTPTNGIGYGSLVMAAFAVPLFLWSAFNAGYFDLESENFIIPLAVFFGAPIALFTAIALRESSVYRAMLAGVLGGYWLSYGGLLWLMHNDVIGANTVTDHMRGLFFAAWAVTFAIVWLGSVGQFWTYNLVTLGATVMLVLLSASYFGAGNSLLDAAGWVGFVTAGLAWYASLAEMLNIEYRRPVLPTDINWFRRIRAGHR